jgi:hypothetical protein
MNWKVAPHNGMWIQEQGGEVEHSPFLEQMLRVVYREDPYEEFSVGAGDAKRLCDRLNALERESDEMFAIAAARILNEQPEAQA